MWVTLKLLIFIRKKIKNILISIHPPMKTIRLHKSLQ